MYLRITRPSIWEPLDAAIRKALYGYVDPRWPID